jgi:predicted DNA-binding protein (UPF0251 family)
MVPLGDAANGRNRSVVTHCLPDLPSCLEFRVTTHVPPVMTPEKVKVARDLYRAKDLTVEEIARTIGVSRKTVYRHLIDPSRVASAQIA